MPAKVDHDSYALCAVEFIMPKERPTAWLGDTYARMEEAGAALIRELQRVGWDVPHLDVKIGTVGKGRNLYRSVRSVSGTGENGPFRLQFNGKQAQRGNYNVNTELCEATVPPGIEFRHYNDGSGSAVLYTGKDWKKDGDAFISDSKVNSKLNGEPKRYLKYDLRGNVLRHDNDLGREYEPNWREPKSLTTASITSDIADFVNGLTGELKKLPSAPGHDDIQPAGDANMRRLCEITPQPAPDDFPVLYAWVRESESGNLYGYDRTNPEQDYALSGGGWRLAGGGAWKQDMNPRAFSCFHYASTAPNPKAGHRIYSTGYDTVPVEVRLKDLNDIYVVDHAAFDVKRDQTVEIIKKEGRDRFTNAELDACQGAVARTMVPASEYAGGFAQPVYCIGRQLGFEEARPMFGPSRIHKDEKGIRVAMKDEITGIEVELFGSEGTGKFAVEAAERAKKSMDYNSNLAREYLNPRATPALAEPEPRALSM